jgi:hypothetical protein
MSSACQQRNECTPVGGRPRCKNVSSIVANTTVWSQQCDLSIGVAEIFGMLVLSTCLLWILCACACTIYRECNCEWTCKRSRESKVTRETKPHQPANQRSTFETPTIEPPSSFALHPIPPQPQCLTVRVVR